VRRVRLVGDRRRAEREAAYRELPGFDLVAADADLLDVFGTWRELPAEVTAALMDGNQALVHAPPVEWASELLSLCGEHGERLIVARPARPDRRVEALRAQLQTGEMGPLAAIRVIRLASGETSLAELEWWALDALLALGGAVGRVFCQRTALRGDAEDQALSVVRFKSGAIGFAEAGNAYPPAAARTLIEVTGEGGMLEYDSLAAPNRLFADGLEVLEEEYVDPPLQRELRGLLAEPDSDTGPLLGLAAAAVRVAGGAEAVEV
jgi:predicted dehydrogenase